MNSRMMQFVCGHAMVFAAAFIATVGMKSHSMPPRTDARIAMGIAVCAVPVAAAAGAAMLIQAQTPRRLLDRGSFRSTSAAVLGVFSGLLALVLDGVLAATINPLVTGTISLAVTSFFAAGVTLVALAGRRAAGCCLQCEYDISASLASGRCPECGTKF